MNALSKPVHASAAGNESTWYKDAVIYEVRTRSFFDSNDDGIGDFPGLASKLDYLSDLGVTALWLLPFFPSPGRDDGYDIMNYTGVHPDVGTLEDFERLLAEAHSRGIRVIIELVLNHTSDQHPWFQRARSAPRGSTERDFYVWGDSPTRYPDARIIFKDFEVSNWTWDRTAQSYYWHRFYAHQPDLNFENPAVHRALFDVVDFWLEKGVDGLRLDAVPYLYEAEGTHCENLPATHAFLKELRAHVDSKFENRMLLAEANQWPEDAAAYFGRGDECHMNFHFPLMPRMFMALAQEDRFPLIDIFAQTPEVDEACQWALFLRNHDELTLEMVSDDERDYMYRAYADQPAMRINLGIRRRLAPLVGNSRRKIELLSALLFSLPGTPVIYYGDEIGMGDNVYLGDRNGVRTPMQWNMDRNAGFSRANPQQLILPVIIDPEYHYESLNVENQQQNPTSLLWWTKRILALRKRYIAFGRGSTEFLSPENSRVLAFVRNRGTETVLVVANLSRFTQFAKLDLAKYEGNVPVELFGRTQFPAVSKDPYLLTLGPHGFYWFSLEPLPTTARVHAAPPRVRCTRLDALLNGDERRLIDEVLPALLFARPWFSSRHRTLRSAQVTDAILLEASISQVWFLFVRADYADAGPENYVIPVAWAPTGQEPEEGDVLLFARVAGEKADRALVDALDDPALATALLGAIAASTRLRGERSDLVAEALDGLRDASTEGLAATRIGKGRQYTTVLFGDRHVLKLLRRLDDGVSPELDIGRYLARRGSEVVPRLSGSLELVRPRTEPATVAIVHAFVPHENTAYQFTIEELGRYFDRALARQPGAPCPPPPVESLAILAGRDPPPTVAELMGGYRVTAVQLGLRVAELHLALAGNADDPAFSPEPYSTLGIRAKYQGLRTLCGRVLRTLRERIGLLPPAAKAEAGALIVREKEIIGRFEPLLRTGHFGARIRGHGNLDLRHALYTGKDFVLVDFHGHSSLSLFERRRKRSPLRDLAWMASSFECAALQLLFDPAVVRERDFEIARPWALQWASWAAAAFTHAYLTATAAAPFLVADREALSVHFDALIIERALHRLHVELEDPSPSVMIPMLSLARALDK